MGRPSQAADVDQKQHEARRGVTVQAILWSAVSAWAD